MKKLLFALLVVLSFPSLAFATGGCQTGWTTGNVCNVTSDGSTPSCELVDLKTAIGQVEAGDTIQLPTGTCTWGTGGDYASVNKAITIAGNGRTNTVITLSSTGGIWTSGVLRISAAATIKSMTATSATTGQHGSFIAAQAANFRITDIAYASLTTEESKAYFIYADSYGLIDNCTVSAVHGWSEPIFVRGPSDSWQTDNSVGTENNLFIENCIFSGVGYPDFNDNARVVFRYNTINDSIKVDAHGRCSNGTRGARHYEIYNNLWTGTSYFWTAMELRGGSGIVANNKKNSTLVGYVNIVLTDYAAQQSGCSGYPGVYACPTDYPLIDQIGVGKDPKSAHSEPLYIWGNLRGDNTPWTGGPTSAMGPAEAEAQCGVGAFDGTSFIHVGSDYIESARPGWSAYTCPHPSAGLSGSCGSGQGVTSYNIEGGTPNYTLTFSVVGGGCSWSTASEVLTDGVVDAIAALTIPANYSYVSLGGTCTGTYGTGQYTSAAGDSTDCTVIATCKKLSPNLTFGSGPGVTFGSGPGATLR
jgi:hypothetical protein